MSFSPSSPVTGAAETGLTSPTYTIAADTPPDTNAKQYAVTALGGTQAGVNVHSVSIPFLIVGKRPKNIRVLGTPNPVTGIVSNVPRNTHTYLTIKGVLPLSGQPYQNLIVRTTIDVPAGSDSADAPNIRAALSAHIGTLWAQSSGIGDTLINAVL
jgi:hypothetical protein